MGRKLGVTTRFGKAAASCITSFRRHFAFICWRLPCPRSHSKKPGPTARAFRNQYRGDQAAGLYSFEAEALIGSTVSVATVWPSSASSLACAVKVSYCFLACEVHSSMAAAGVFTPNSSCAKSSEEVVLALKNSISLALYALAPLLAVVNTASMVPLWVSAASLNLA